MWTWEKCLKVKKVQSRLQFTLIHPMQPEGWLFLLYSFTQPWTTRPTRPSFQAILLHTISRDNRSSLRNIRRHALSLPPCFRQISFFFFFFVRSLFLTEFKPCPSWQTFSAHHVTSSSLKNCATLFFFCKVASRPSHRSQSLSLTTRASKNYYKEHLSNQWLSFCSPTRKLPFTLFWQLKPE